MKIKIQTPIISKLPENKKASSNTPRGAVLTFSEMTYDIDKMEKIPDRRIGYFIDIDDKITDEFYFFDDEVYLLNGARHSVSSILYLKTNITARAIMNALSFINDTNSTLKSDNKSPVEELRTYLKEVMTPLCAHDNILELQRKIDAFIVQMNEINKRFHATSEKNKEESQHFVQTETNDFRLIGNKIGKRIKNCSISISQHSGQIIDPKIFELPPHARSEFRKKHIGEYIIASFNDNIAMQPPLTHPTYTFPSKIEHPLNQIQFPIRHINTIDTFGAEISTAIERPFIGLSQQKIRFVAERPDLFPSNIDDTQQALAAIDNLLWACRKHIKEFGEIISGNRGNIKDREWPSLACIALYEKTKILFEDMFAEDGAKDISALEGAALELAENYNAFRELSFSANYHRSFERELVPSILYVKNWANRNITLDISPRL